MAKSPRHKRMYSDSPKLERDDDGNMKAKKPSEKAKTADAVQGGVDDKSDGEPDMEPYGAAREQELKDMHKRHQDELSSYHKRHAKESAKQAGDDIGTGQADKIEKETAE